MKKIRIGPGQHYVTRHNERIMTVLGSCVAACIRDPVAGIGGMNHFMLPESADGVWGAANATMRYGNFAMERLINDILRGGGLRSRLEVKVFGGAAMVAGSSMVGHQNADFVEAYLEAENMAVAASHLRGSHARRIDYTPLSGRVMMLEIIDGAVPLVQAEQKVFATVQGEPDGGTIELFD
jgi:chemotaxis protein CheD